MGSLGLPEIAFIVLVALLIFGPKKLPELGRTVGRGMAEFRRATDELKRSINSELALDENPVPPILRTRRLEDPDEVNPPEPVQHEAVIVAGPPGEAPEMTEPRSAGFPTVAVAAAAEPVAGPVVAPEPSAAHEPVAASSPDLPGHP
ncbi:MAG TPA: twin-arginine translocase TatA/TatE family subunit [Thermoanaerobaculia bacterium]|jgi:TatA/E family protein of Tat protein translocase|nr:twin-arginine translocase TatA/TatE family subunit [Thermoanaerobaculia bacterium]